jgi:hypothetical protein
VTSDELQAGTCPVCQAAFSAPAESSVAAKAPAPEPGLGLFSLLSGAFILVLAGGLAGFFLHPQLRGATPEPGNDAPASLVSDTRKDGAARFAAEEATKARKRQKELEAQLRRVSEELRAQKKLTTEADERTEAARNELEETREATEVRLKELNKELADARKPEKTTPPVNPARLATLEAVFKKVAAELDVQKRQAREALGREAAARRNVDQVRKEGQLALEQLRRESQKTIEQVRREKQQGIDQARKEKDLALAQARKELDKQRTETQKARAEADKYKRAAEEAKKKK